MHHIDRIGAVGRDLGGLRRPQASRARSSTSARATSPAGGSRRPTSGRAAAAVLGLVSEQSLYNLLQRTVELEVAPACEAYGIGLIPWSPLGGGLLGGILRKAKRGPLGAPSAPRSCSRSTGRRSRRTRRSATSSARTPADVALAWLLHQPAVTAPIIGPRTIEQLTALVARRRRSTLDETALAGLDELFPGPGGPAPEAYAW